jgi:hypothetical protein
VKQNEKEPRAPLHSIDDKLLMYLMAMGREKRALLLLRAHLYDLEVYLVSA